QETLPRASTYLKYAAEPRSTPAAAAASPVSGPLEPIVIFEEETPGGVPETAAPAMPASTRATSAPAETSRFLVIAGEGTGAVRRARPPVRRAAGRASGRRARRRTRTS